jgi:hypothetical protein
MAVVTGRSDISLGKKTYLDPEEEKLWVSK